ncbi:MAG: hypothetical protein ACKO38_06910, partial [Planctomycetota bacterium]
MRRFDYDDNDRDDIDNNDAIRLTIEMAEDILEYHDYDTISEFTSIDDEAALLLSRHVSVLELDGLRR